MKLRHLIAIVTAFSVIGIAVSGCASTRENRDLPWSLDAESSDEFNINDKIILSIDETTISSTSVTYTITNNDIETIAVGQAYSLQILEKGKWHKIECYQDWTLDLVELAPADSVSIFVDWTNYYGELPHGTYRLVKEVTITDEVFLVCCEFGITDNQTEG